MKTGPIAGGLSLLIFVFAVMMQNHGSVTPTAAPPQGGAWRAFEWWYAQRAFPHSHIPSGALRSAHAWKKSQKELKNRIAINNSPSSSASEWKSLGPTNIGGRVLSIAMHPFITGTLFSGSASGGLWKTTTGGTGAGAWTYMNTGFPVLSVSAIAIDPVHPDTMYIGTGEISRYVRPLIGVVGARSSYGLGILRSTDGGESWDTTGLSWSFAGVTAVQKIIINPLNTSTIFAATSEGVYKSTDAGTSWSLSNSVLMAMDLILNPVDTTVLLSSHGNLNSSPGAGMYMSFDAGESWSKIDGGLPATDFGRTALAISPSNPSYVYAGIANGANSTAIGIYRSTDGGGSWSLRTSTNYVGSQGWYNNAMAVHPTDPFTLYAAGLNAHKSPDGGATLPTISAGSVHVDHHAIAFDPSDPNIVYFGTDGGMFKTTNGGTSFEDLNNGFLTTQFYPGFAVAADDSNLALGGLQDNGTLRYSGSTAWFPVWGGDGGWCAIDPTNKNIMYAETQYGRIVRSYTGGTPFNQVTSGLPGSQAEWNFIPPFVLSPSNTNVLYAGCRNVYKTTNQGSSWFPANGNATLNGTTISCIAVSKSSEDTLLAGTGTGSFGVTPLFQIFSSTNGGASWSNVTGSLPDRYPTDLEFDPHDSRVAYVTYSGYGTSHLFKTTDLGATWVDLSGTLPDMPHQCITVDPVYPNYLYVGTDLGVYQSSNSGLTWTEYNDGMPDAMILDLVVSPSNNALRAATFGNGVYQRHLPRFSTISLSHPSGGEIFVAGEVESITWDESYTAFVDIDYSTNGGSDWLAVADSVDAAAETFEWSVPWTGTVSGLVRISNSGGGSPSDSNITPFTIIVGPDLLSGWNMVSLPVATDSYLKDSLFPTSVSRAFGYQNGYLFRDTLSNGDGYWLKFTMPQFTDLTGDSIFTDSINIQSGWNMIGSISLPIPVGEIVQEPGGMITSSVFEYRQGYNAVDTILPGRGYWVKSLSAGKIHLSTLAASSSRGTTIAVTPREDLNMITLRDAAGNRQRLYFTTADEHSTSPAMELPPPAPGTSADIRFASGQGLEILGSPDCTDSEKFIMTKNLTAPVTLEWEVIDGRRDYRLTDPGGSTISLLGSGSITLDSSPAKLSLHRGTVSGERLPESYSLFQNYPNPFNPLTTISFSLPADSPVRLAIYDNTGREIAILLEATMTAGNHSIEWNASQYASGVYFYRLVAADRTFSRKMLLLK